MRRAFADAIEWLDGAFNGVTWNDERVVVALGPEPPFAVSVFDDAAAGTMLDIRSCLLRNLPFSKPLTDFISNISTDNVIAEGHLILRREALDGYCGLELRYCIQAALVTTQHTLVQLGMRMSTSVHELAIYLQETFGGNPPAERGTAAFEGYSSGEQRAH